MRFRLFLPLALAALAIFGCGDEFMTTDMQSNANADGYTLTLAASPDNLNILAGGTITIMAEVLDPEGNGVSSAAVVLSTTMGTLTETDLTTDADGFAVTTLTAASVTGYAIVVATYRGAQSMVKVNFWSGAAS